MQPQAPTVLVLLVEDDPLLLLPIEEGLRDAGFEPVVALNGKEAVAEMDRDAARFRALITDIRLGPGPDGWEVARHARHLIPSIPVIYCSGDSAAAWTENGVPNSIMLEKPFAMVQLTTALATLMNQASLTAQL